MMRAIFLIPLFAAALLAGSGQSAEPDDLQPVAAMAKRVAEALEVAGSPLKPAARSAIERAAHGMDPAADLRSIENALDPLCILHVNINPESRVKVAPGAARAELVQGGWRSFLVRVENEAGVTSALQLTSPQARPLANAPKSELTDRWFDILSHDKQPLRATLSGLPLEYRVVSLYSRDAGRREARISADAGQGTQDLGFRSEADILFTALPAREVELNLLDEQGEPTTAALLIRDSAGRVYPSQAKRLAPDFAFHPQIYREDGEKLMLPPGTYEVEVSRGPEYLLQRRTLKVGRSGRNLFRLRLARWIDPSKSGWWSGDHHIHAAGCAHYTNPTEGVHAPDMARHCRGEDLKVGCNLTWGPCFDYQKQFFTGKVDPVSRFPYLIRYDVEVSGFGSHQSGHLCLLRLRDQMYPGGDSKDHWPTLGLNTLRWARKQGAVTGPAHSGWGLDLPNADLPNYAVPPFSGIGANEYIVDVTHQVPGPDGASVPAVDFISTVDTPYAWELNIWYHTLNAGYRTRISGETDFPCIYGERVGLGRSYIKLNGKLDFDAWCEGIRQGRCYVSDGRSHLMDFNVGGIEVGEHGSELRLAQGGPVKISATVAARLDEKPNPDLSGLPYTQKPYWHLERARKPGTRLVPVELLVNGEPVSRRDILADGTESRLEFSVDIERSSWVALRILPSSHTNPVFVVVDNKPIRASRRSVEWCLKGVDQCWSQKRRFIKQAEMADAVAAYEHARREYRRILEETEAP